MIMIMMMIMIIIEIIIILITPENSPVWCCAPTLGSTDVKIQNIRKGK